MANDITLGLILTANVSDLVSSLEDTEKSSKEAGETLEKSFDEAGKAIDETGDAVKKTALELSATMEIAQNFSDSVGALVDFAKEAAGAFLEFNGALAEVTTLVNSAEVSNQSLSNSIMNLSLQYGAAPVDTAKALYQTLSAGASAGESANNMLAVAMQTSIGGVTDVTTAVDGLTTVINAYGMDASEANNVADTMFTTMKNGKTTIAELSSNYSSAIPTAAALGVSFEELNAAVVGMTLQGTGTAETMTSLNRVMASLTKPSDDLNAIFNALGYSSAEVAIKQEGLGFALNAISNAAGGSVSKIGELLGSVKASAVVLSLAGDKAHFLTDAMDKMKNKSGALSEGFEKVMSSPEKQFEIALNKIQVATIKFGEQAIRAFLPFLEGIGSIIDSINKFANESPKMFSAITQGVTLFAVLAAGVGATAVVITGITAFVGALAPVFITASTAIGVASVAMKGFVLSMGPIGLVIAGVAAGFAAISYFANQSEQDLEASHAQLKGMLDTAKNFNTAIDTLKNSEVVSDEVIQQIEAVKAAVMSGQMTEAEGMAIANQYLDQLKKRTEAEASMENDLALKKEQLTKLEEQRLKEVTAFRLNTALEAINAQKEEMNSGYNEHIQTITDNLKKEVDQLKASGASTSEIAKVQAKAAQEILTVEQERAAKSLEIAEQTFQKKKEILEAEGGADVAQKVYEAEKEFAQARIEIAKQTHETLVKNLNATEQEIEQYAAQIKGIERSIADEKLTTADRIAKVRRAEMTEEQAQAAISQQIAQRRNELSNAFKSGDVEGAKAFTASLIGIAKESEDTTQAVNSLRNAANEALSSGNTEQAKQLANAMSEMAEQAGTAAEQEQILQSASNIRVEALGKEKAAAEEAKKIAEERAEQERAAVEAQRVALEENTKALQTLTEGGESKLTISVQAEQAKAQIQEIEDKLNALKNTTINVNMKTTEAKAGGGVIGMAMGDVVPGVGDSDSVPALLTPGEYVVRKARSIQFRDLLNAINYGSDELLAQLMTIPKLNLGGLVDMPSFQLPTLRLAEGGFIPTTPQGAPQMPTESIRIDFSMGNQSGSLLASPAAEARKFAAMLREMKRGS